MAEQLNPAQRQAKQDADDKKIRAEEEKRGGAPTPQRPVNTPKPYAKGGKVRGGGCEQRGKTKGRFV